MDMNSLGISNVGEVLRGNTTISDKIKNDSNFNEPICPPQMTGSLTNYNNTRKSNNNNNGIEQKEENIRINHLYIKDEIYIHSLDEYRYKYCEYGDYDLMKGNQYLTLEEKKKAYNGEEDKIYCGRFPHLSYCGCKFPCSIILDKIHPIEIIDNIYCGPIECAYKTKELLHLKIKYILNVSCITYRKRIKYFKYYDIYINDNNTENAIKFFKITNRFIEEAVNNGKILIHSENGQSRCFVFILAYLIGRKNFKFADAYEKIKEKFRFAEPNDNFLTQLKHYDLEVNV